VDERPAVATERSAKPDEDLVGLYLREVGRHALLTRDEEVRLARAIEDGRAAHERLAQAQDGQRILSGPEGRELRRRLQAGDAATESLIEANLRLVVSIAKRFQGSALPLLDLIQEGNLGLMRAVDKFDWRRGFKFSTYATWWIRQAIRRGIENSSRTIRLPVNAGNTLGLLDKSKARLAVTLGRPPTRAELVADIEISAARFDEIVRHLAPPLSLSEPRGADSEAELGDLVADQEADAPFEAVAASLLVGEIVKLLGTLNARERTILCLHFGLDRGEPRTLKEVGEILELTGVRIRQIEADAMSKLRQPAVHATVRELLDDG
jgi:RNA polymerase sigma factor (sigma-70 family)